MPLLCGMGIPGSCVVYSSGFLRKSSSERSFFESLSENVFSFLTLERQFTWVLNSRLQVIFPQKFGALLRCLPAVVAKGKPETIVISTPL